MKITGAPSNNGHTKPLNHIARVSMILLLNNLCCFNTTPIYNTVHIYFITVRMNSAKGERTF